MKIIVIPHQNSSESKEGESQEEEPVVVDKWCIMLMQVVYDEPDGVDSCNCAELHGYELKAVFQHASDGQLPDRLLYSYASMLHVGAPFPVQVFTTFFI